MIHFQITLTGTSELLMHNSRLANPLDPATKAMKKVHGKSKKTDEDYEELARLEHAGGLYIDPDVGPYIPSDNIWRSLYDGAKKHKLGVKVKEGVALGVAIKNGAVVSESVNPLSYKGPRDVDGLWKDENFRHFASVKVSMSRVMRCRPIFREWKTEATGILDPNVLDYEELLMVAETAGQMIGLGDWRPKFGRYIAEVKKLK